MTSQSADYPTRPCADCGSIYEQRYYHALGSCEPCNTRQRAVSSGRATLADWRLSQVPAAPVTPPTAPKQAKVALVRPTRRGGFEACASRLPTASWSHDR